MLFTSIPFLYYFLPLVLITYFIMPKKYRNIVLLIFSIIFYAYGEPKYVFLMLLEILVAYFGAIIIDKNSKYKDITLIVVLIIHIGLLGIFKYTDFLILNINKIFNSHISLLNIVMPIGISFYTFQIISYLVDVYRKEVKPQENILKLATYVTLFPQLIAGPIVRYKDINKELDKKDEKLEDVSYGFRRFIIGLAKKVIIANSLGELVNILDSSVSVTIVATWLKAISYMMQIYFDFSAYSDMAIGLGRIFGFHFLENFDYPYMSKSITEFWRRWHISLGSWFRDYVYIPLGGSRRGNGILIRNILIVWALTGLWHGASWNFIIWGLYFGILLLIEKLFVKKYLEKIPGVFRCIYTLFIVLISFIIFSADSMNGALLTINNLFRAEMFIDEGVIYYLKSYLPLLIVSLFGVTPLIKNIYIKMGKNKSISKILNILEPVFLLLLLVIVTAYLIDSSYNPFLYFRF
mgnify:FL=1